MEQLDASGSEGTIKKAYYIYTDAILFRRTFFPFE